MTSSYDGDVVAWANEQARFIRSGQFDRLDLEHVADEIEAVGRSEQREWAGRMAVLLAQILKWKCQPEKRSISSALTIKEQRRLLVRQIHKAPSLAPMLADPDWIDEIWVDAKAIVHAGILGRVFTCVATLAP